MKGESLKKREVLAERRKERHWSKEEYEGIWNSNGETKDIRINNNNDKY